MSLGGVCQKAEQLLFVMAAEDLWLIPATEEKWLGSRARHATRPDSDVELVNAVSAAWVVWPDRRPLLG
jgi:hypothetical protein